MASGIPDFQGVGVYLKKLVIYEGANHGVGDAPSVTNGQDKVTMIADWLLDRVNGDPAKSERIWVDSSGREHAGTFPAPE